MLSLERLSRALAGRYEVERELGRGGTSIVYLARDLRHQRHVALKVLDPELATSVGAERFLLEVRTTAQLNHPHILPLHDSGETDGILYYVIPYVEGQSLRERLADLERLPLDEALRIASEVADALVYAHSNGFIHRDIKPGNILLGHAGHTYVADFGLARAVFGAVPGQLTTGRLAVGTPWYMSPEQAVGDTEIGTATDVYSLGCVLFEMLTGRPPFTAPSVQAVLAAHISTKPRPVHTLRSDTPSEVEAIVEGTLAKDPEARPRGEDLLARLRRARPPVSHSRPPGRWTQWIPGPIGSTLLLALAAILTLVVATFPRSPGGGVAADTTAYVVFPIDGPAGSEAVELASSLSDALREWQGITVRDSRRVEEALARSGDGALDLADARNIALRLDAGRLVMGRVSSRATERVLAGTVYDATVEPETMPALAHATRTLPESRGDREEAFERLAYSLLFPDIRGIDGPIDHPGTKVVPALRAYARGHEALGDGDLGAADSAFATAGDLDPDFGEAHLWLAQVRGWASDDEIDRLLAATAVNHLDPADHRHHQLARALLQLAEGDFPRACEIYDSLVTEEGSDFWAWYGVGECHRRDDLVVVDETSPTGYAFRSSNHRALVAYEEAFSIRPGMMAMFSAGGYDRLRELLVPGSAFVRAGRTTSGEVYLAYPAWRGDTLAFTPFPQTEMEAGSPDLIPPTRARAIREAQQRFENLTRLWVRNQRTSAAATEAHAVALDMLGDPGALDAFQHARELAEDPVVAARIGAHQVWLTLRVSLPDDTLQLRRARAMADTLLAETASWPAADRYELAGLTALAGDAELTGRLMAADPAEAGERRRWGRGIVRESNRLLAYAAIGQSPDSLRVIERRLLRMMRAQLPLADRERARISLLTLPARLALPVYPLETLDDLTDPVARLGGALASGGPGAASDNEYLARAAERPPATRSLDATFVEAWLMLQIGDMEGAAVHLDRRLEVLSSGMTGIRRVPIQIATLVRAICLRWDIANRRDEAATSETWGRALRIIKGVDADAPHSTACGSGRHSRRGGPS